MNLKTIDIFQSLHFNCLFIYIIYTAFIVNKIGSEGIKELKSLNPYINLLNII